MKARQLWVLFHRWGGLLLALPLILVALTGSIIAFTHEVNHYLITPEHYAKVQTGVPVLDIETLLERAQALVLPGEHIESLSIAPEQFRVGVKPAEIQTAKGNKGEGEKVLSYAIFLDPWTGKELARQYPVNGEPIRDNRLMRFFHALHDHLYLGKDYMWVLGIFALLWTVDCFVSWYLTLPNSSKDFWRRWKPAWKIKSKASTYRLNFDLHRANGLWLWPLLFVFAWSSVSLNLPMVYDPVTKLFFDYNTRTEQREQMAGQQKAMMQKYKTAPEEAQPALADILTTAKRLGAEEAAKQGFAIGQTVAVNAINRRQGSSLINVSLRSHEARCEDIYETSCRASLSFDGKSGELVEWRTLGQQEIQNEPIGNFLTRWMRILHFGQSLGLAYQIFVSVLGIIITVITVTGVYIWWIKRKARKHSAAKVGEADLAADVAQ